MNYNDGSKWQVYRSPFLLLRSCCQTDCEIKPRDTDVDLNFRQIIFAYTFPCLHAYFVLKIDIKYF